MNPGLLNQVIRLQRQGLATDELGQRLDTWSSVYQLRARRKPVKSRAKMEEVIANRDTERRTMVFQLRARPFITLYQAGDRLLELARKDFPEEVWKITGWSEIEGTNGMYVEVGAEADLKSLRNL